MNYSRLEVWSCWVLDCKFREYCIIYVMVRLFGFWAWKKDSKNPINKKHLTVNKTTKLGKNAKKYKFWRHS